MSRWIVRIGLALLLVMLVAAPVTAGHGDPVGGCPDGFHLHHVGEHHHHGGQPHRHIGNDKDQNEDGYLCVKHVGKDEANHVHIDNNVP